ncbi:MAG: hypothetical protein ABI538_02340 [Pseudoxanthomonas sp.]
MRCQLIRLFSTVGLLFLGLPAAIAQQCPANLPVQGAPISSPLPVFPADNWWNTDIRSAPVDPASANFISFIGGTRKLHPDFGGEESAGSTAIYGFPYAVVDSAQVKKTVVFDYDDESDGNGIPFYPIPSQAISQTHWVEGGAAGSVDQRSDNDRHLLMIDCSNRTLYELYNVWYSTAQQQWHAGSGALFDMNRNDRRPNGWTSADAAGLAIFPGLVRYDEAANAAVPEIEHALRVTMRASNGYVYPASHDAGSTAGALPMGARLRLKSLVNGVDPATRTSDPTARKIFRAMQKYGLIMADNGSDMYISGTFDLRWNNGVLNPAFSTLSASDFEVVQLGWKPAAITVVLSAISASPNPVYGGQASIGTVTLGAAAPAGGTVVALSSASHAFTVPASVTVGQGATSATFNIASVTTAVAATGTLSATYAGTTKTTTFTVNPTPSVLSISDALAGEGDTGTRTAVFNVSLSKPATSVVTYTATTVDDNASAGSDYLARSASGQSIAIGQTSNTFTVVINGDTLQEDNERFRVNLSAVSGAILGDGQAVGTIIDDEGHIKMPGSARVAAKPVVPPPRPATARTLVILRRIGLLRRQLQP